MQPQMKVVVCMTVILAVIPYGLCIKCWSCSSSNDPKCADPFDNSTVLLTDCNIEKGPTNFASMCKKIRQKVNEEWINIRECAYLDEENMQGDEKNCFMRNGTEYCTCNNKDGCNSSFTFAPKPVLLLLAVVTAGLEYVL